MDVLTKPLAPGIAILLTLVFGFWLGKIGKPYNGMLFNIHKLIALGAVVATAIQVYRSFPEMASQPWLILSIAVVALCVVALFASGAFLSIGNIEYTVARMIHNVSLILAAAAMGFALYFLNIKL